MGRSHGGSRRTHAVGRLVGQLRQGAQASGALLEARAGRRCAARRQAQARGADHDLGRARVAASSSRRSRRLKRRPSTEIIMPSTSTRADWRTPTAVLICSGMVLTLAMGIRHGFGLFLQPMTIDLHWSRETFALALAVQNLVWGATQPFAGMLADKYGSGRVVLGGALLYVLGLALMAHPGAPWQFVLSAGVLIGIGLSGVTFSVISGVLGRPYPPEKRSMALGISAAAGAP